MGVTVHRSFTVLAIMVLTLPLILQGCGNTEDDDRPNANDFRIKSWSQTQVRAGFGEPKLTQSFTKTGNPVWGEIQNVWHKVPQGATVDIWVYEVQGGGNIELYFIRPSSLVWEVGFAPEGTVY